MTTSSPATVSVAKRGKGLVAIGLGSGRKGARIGVAVPGKLAAATARWRASGSTEWKEMAVAVREGVAEFKHPGTPGELALGGDTA